MDDTTRIKRKIFIHDAKNMQASVEMFFNKEVYTDLNNFELICEDGTTHPESTQLFLAVYDYHIAKQTIKRILS
jgi:hypothetical protein